MNQPLHTSKTSQRPHKDSRRFGSSSGKEKNRVTRSAPSALVQPKEPRRQERRRRPLHPPQRRGTVQVDPAEAMKKAPSSDDPETKEDVKGSQRNMTKPKTY